jgi:hypothetical protein
MKQDVTIMRSLQVEVKLKQIVRPCWAYIVCTDCELVDNYFSLLCFGEQL